MRHTNLWNNMDKCKKVRHKKKSETFKSCIIGNYIPVAGCRLPDLKLCPNPHLQRQSSGQAPSQRRAESLWIHCTGSYHLDWKINTWKQRRQVKGHIQVAKFFERATLTLWEKYRPPVNQPWQISPDPTAWWCCNGEKKNTISYCWLFLIICFVVGTWFLI